MVFPNNVLDFTGGEKNGFLVIIGFVVVENSLLNEVVWGVEENGIRKLVFALS